MTGVVADTNVYVSALNFGGVADDVLALGRSGDITLFVSTSILQEVEGVLTRKFKWSSGRAREAIAAIATFTDLVHPTEVISHIEEDETDNRILECAHEARAQYIVTGDRHLQKLKSYCRVDIVSPGHFLELGAWV